MPLTDWTIQLNHTWEALLKDEFDKPYMTALRHFLLRQQAQGKTTYPKEPNIFAALNAMQVNDVKVVILGQDPYHGAGQAHGLSFSVPPDTPIPPSLQNIYKAMQHDLGIPPAQHGHLAAWATQGVLLLNSVLTVEAHHAGSHQNQGWETFTDAIINRLSQHHQNLVFLLWGRDAQKKGQCIDPNKHLILKAVHPSPLSAYRGFLTCQHFSKTNTYLQQTGKSSIDWLLPANACPTHSFKKESLHD